MAAWREFLVAAHLVERHIEEQLKDASGLTHAQYEILVHLAGAPDRQIRMTQLARRLVVTKSGLTYQIGQLEKRGLVERRPCPSDERGILAVLTDQGMRCLEDAAPGHVHVVRETLIDLLEPGELDAIAQALGKVRRALQRPDQAGDGPWRRPS